MEFWGYKNEARLRGLTENQDFGNPRRRVLFVALALLMTVLSHTSSILDLRALYCSFHCQHQYLQ
jgi:hypothetical protein